MTKNSRLSITDWGQDGIFCSKIFNLKWQKTDRSSKSSHLKNVEPGQSALFALKITIQQVFYGCLVLCTFSLNSVCHIWYLLIFWDVLEFKSFKVGSLNITVQKPHRFVLDLEVLVKKDLHYILCPPEGAENDDWLMPIYCLPRCKTGFGPFGSSLNIKNIYTQHIKLMVWILKVINYTTQRP